MTIRMRTSALIGLLTDLIQTADHDPDASVMDAILLHSTTGYIGAEPGKVEMLAGISSDRHVAGHTYTPCGGGIGDVSLWSVRDAQSVITVFKAARGKDSKDLHAVEIRVEAGEVQISEDPNLIDDGVSLRFGEREAADYPARVLYDILDADLPTVISVGGAFVDATPRTDMWQHVLTPFVKVGKRRGAPLRIYRGHQHKPVLIQIGDTYRGLLLPYRPTEVTGDEQRPDAEIHPPDLGHARWRKPETTTVDVSKDGGQTWTQLDLDLVELSDDTTPDDPNEES